MRVYLHLRARPGEAAERAEQLVAYFPGYDPKPDQVRDFVAALRAGT